MVSQLSQSVRLFRFKSKSKLSLNLLSKLALLLWTCCKNRRFSDNHEFVYLLGYKEKINPYFLLCGGHSTFLVWFALFLHLVPLSKCLQISRHLLYQLKVTTATCKESHLVATRHLQQPVEYTTLPTIGGCQEVAD